MVLWCILTTSAIFPSSTPSTIHISHRGRSRWSCRLITSAAKSPSSRIPPGDGSVARRRWLSMSNSGSSTQTGWPSRSGTSTNRRWKTGTSGMRSLMSWRTRRKEYPPGTVEGSNTAVMATCMCSVGVSM